MKIKEIQAKSIIVKSNLPDGDFVINPYTGCSHGCKYCYARFMKRFTGHTESWGEFVDIKTNAPELILKNASKFKWKSIVIGSVTDPYQPIEKKYKLTRKILENLIPLQPHLNILTKSDLVIRDIDLLRQFKHCIVSVSLSTLDEKTKKELELSTPIKNRIETLKILNKNEIQNVLFISPIFPELTDWKKVITLTKDFVSEYWFENLNLYSSVKNNIYTFLKNHNPSLIDIYNEIFSANSNYWDQTEKEIKKICKENNIKCKIYFHHKKR